MFGVVLVTLLAFDCCWCFPVAQLSNSENDQGEYSYLHAGPGALPTLTQLSFCARTNLEYLEGSYTLMFYGNETTVQFQIGMNIGNELLYISSCDNHYASVNFPIRLSVWQHWCLSINPITSRLSVGFSGKVISENISTECETVLESGGHLFFGQYIIWSRGVATYTDKRSVIQMADLQLYDREMTEQDMESYMNCSKLSYHPLLTMENELLQVEGSARLINISAEEVCEQPTSMVVMHQNKLKFKDAEMWCSKFGGSLVLPENNVTDTALFLDFLPSVQSCVQSSGHFYWLGAVGNLTTGKWQNYIDGEPLIWDNFYLPMKNVTERSKCLSVYKYFDYPIWVSTSCDMEMCVGCSFDNNPKLALRGLCPGSLFDKSYFIIGYSNGSIEYRGMSHTYLKMSCGTWVIKSRIFINLLAKMVMRTEQDIPLGRHLWTLQADTCEQKEIKLVLTPCEYDQYTCDDGTCIASEKRCNLLLDCPDHSDEVECSVWIYSHIYSASHPPPTPEDSSTPLQLNTSLLITSVREININTFTIVIDTSLSISWRDLRLKLKNLQPLMLANKLNETQVWWPNTEIKDASLGEVEMTHASRMLYVRREDEPLPSFMSGEYGEDDVYNGEDNSVVMQEKQIISFKCHLDLQLYPFDTQRCSIIIGINDLHMKYGIMIKDGPGVMFDGKRSLLEYQLVSETMNPYNLSDITVMQVELSFQNLYSYYIGNVFVPSLMMAVVSYLTLFFTIHDFNDRIMVSLTSLLVLAGLFAQTCDSIPKTSYLKLIDCWYLALISQDFFIIVALVGVEGLRQRETQPKSCAVGPVLMAPHNSWTWPHTVNKLARRGFAATLFLIIGVFIFVAHWDWNK